MKPWKGKLRYVKNPRGDWGVLRDQEGRIIAQLGLPTHDVNFLYTQDKNGPDPNQKVVDEILKRCNVSIDWVYFVIGLVVWCGAALLEKLYTHQ